MAHPLCPFFLAAYLYDDFDIDVDLDRRPEIDLDVNIYLDRPCH